VAVHARRNSRQSSASSLVKGLDTDVLQTCGFDTGWNGMNVFGGAVLASRFGARLAADQKFSGPEQKQSGGRLPDFENGLLRAVNYREGV